MMSQCEDLETSRINRLARSYASIVASAECPIVAMRAGPNKTKKSSSERARWGFQA